ncbi:hypothetical protein ES703_11118 [subsurface metagenome]
MKIINRLKCILPVALVLALLITSLTPALTVSASSGLEQVIVSGYYNALSNTATEYSNLAGGVGWNPDPTLRGQIVTTSGSLSNFLVELSEAPGAGTSYTFTLIVNDSPTGVAVTIADTDTTGLDTDSIGVVVGDIVKLKSTYTGTPTTPTVWWSMLFDSSSASESLILSGSHACSVSINYSSISQASPDTTQIETETYQVIPTSGKIKNLYVEMLEDPGDAPDAYCWTLRKNGESTDLSVTITADATEGSDTEHEITVAAGDYVNLMVEPLNTPAVETDAYIGLTFVADIDGESIILGQSKRNPSNINTMYMYLKTTVYGAVWTATEAQRYQGGQPTTLKKLYVKLSEAPGEGKSYLIGVRVNGVTKIAVTISDDETTGNNVVDSWELSNFDNLNIISIPTNEPVWPITAHWGVVSYTAPPPKPTVTTQDATDILSFTATGNGNITALNNGNCDIRGFDWDTDSGAPYANSVSETGSYGIGAYTKTLTDLPQGTTIYYRAKAHSSLGWGYGDELDFVTEGATPPTVATGTAVSITPTGATLQGTLTSLGDYSPVYVFFQYGLTTSYGTSTVEQTMTATGGFNQAISDLSPGKLYHFRAVARHGASAYVYGSDAEFETTTAGAPTVTTGSAVDVTSSTATLQGTLNSLGDYSPVYVAFEWGLTSQYGSQTVEDTRTITGGFNANISGLQAATTYHFRARVRYNGSYVYGNDNTFIEAEPRDPGTDPPDILRIDDIKVFSGYFEGDDQLYVISYRIIYSAGTPILDVGDYFDFQLLDGSVLKAQVPVKAWDYKPGSIYLSAASAPAWGGNYRIKIIGNPAKWETPPECYRDITPGDWQGEDLTQLDTWVISLASSLQSYYSSEMVIYTTGGQAVLSKQGGAIFNMSIPGLSTVRPNLFSATSEYIHPEWEEHPREYEGTLDPKAHLGNYFYGLFEDGADFLNTETKTFGAIVFGVAYLLSAIVIGWKLNNGLVGMGLASPLIILGGWFGLIPLVLIMVVAGVFVIYSIFVIWVKGT